MADEAKPRDAAGYRSDVTIACERTLLTLYGAFGSLKSSLRLVGGLVPRYLTPASPPEVPQHAGTSDVDVVLNLQIIAQGESCERAFGRHRATDGVEPAAASARVAVRWRAFAPPLPASPAAVPMPDTQ